MSVCFLLVVAEILKLDMRAIDVVIAFPQVELDVSVYMELPAGMVLKGCKNSDYFFEFEGFVIWFEAGFG